MNKLRITIIQISAGTDRTQNLATISKLSDDISSTDLIALPEVFALRGADQHYREAAEALNGPVMTHLSKLATEKKAWILAGSIIEKDGDHIFNTSILLNRSGNVAATYRKIHLFEAHLDDGQIIREADTYEAGNTPVLANIEDWKAGLTICYDLRFPELFRHYAEEGANLLFVPSNFTQRTGKDHWEILVRARAIENQCFVIAPNQCGTNEATGIASYGHSMAVGPWGNVLCCADENEQVMTVDLNPAELNTTRSRIPALQHRQLHPHP